MKNESNFLPAIKNFLNAPAEEFINKLTILLETIDQADFKSALAAYQMVKITKTLREDELSEKEIKFLDMLLEEVILGRLLYFYHQSGGPLCGTSETYAIEHQILSIATEKTKKKFN